MRPPSLIHQLIWALALLRDPVAAESFRITKTYDADNFFDEFIFNTIHDRQTGTVATQADDNNSWVQYQNRENATAKKLAVIKNGEIYLGVDHTTKLNSSGPGRDSLRLVSQDAFKYGLLIARFTHLPSRACGAWPAFWTLGVGEWPKAGEIDMYEGWNLNTRNKPAIHVGPSKEFGVCTIEQSEQQAKVISPNCDNKFANNKTQFLNQGCQSEEVNSTMWSAPTGGIQALEWTKEHIKIFTWARGREPKNLNGEEIDTSAWGKPSIQISGSRCDIDRAFQEQRIMFTLPFCGSPVADDDFWNKIDGGSGITCNKATNTSKCVDYIANNPKALKNFYFQIKDLRLYQSTKPDNATSGETPTTPPTPPSLTDPISLTSVSSRPTPTGLVSGSSPGARNATGAPTNLPGDGPLGPIESETSSSSQTSTDTSSPLQSGKPDSSSGIITSPSSEREPGDAPIRPGSSKGKSPGISPSNPDTNQGLTETPETGPSLARRKQIFWVV
ncbi:beta-1,3-endoglucanase [Moelleriella libera RCEF 2490]|uniref:Beta-1,3-endoglucanase n=1 Tax=Moelleriella libera RCEF 2490 TaxID=1081109 RepID=A0A168DFS0_9HYPO|nr:beta-1,3-endoglucanase [Moelleriella libera RCEF 2490]